MERQKKELTQDIRQMGSSQQDKLKAKAQKLQLDLSNLMDQKIEKSREAITTDYELEVQKLRDRLYSSLNIPNAVDYTCGDEQEAQSKGMMWSLNDYLV